MHCLSIGLLELENLRNGIRQVLRIPGLAGGLLSFCLLLYGFHPQGFDELFHDLTALRVAVHQIHQRVIPLLHRQLILKVHYMALKASVGALQFFILLQQLLFFPFHHM